ncbi:protein-export chaperone SecB [Gluconacetobacter entanii]|uniref:Protein-export protein SecB n=1 Tax=Gluconacetobacter entanii TaxID=108528 RepID=A0A318PY65_9PROT|nr:protein-export chaperone SecB [Gluconacetobacter entanii]MBE7620061.1 protein-export chaperone SecB [Komagataeibacter sp. FXV2]MCE2579925.1 protein-export chaperone SecB [Komagataeibacter sp. FNDCR1]MBY4641654.1 protein-export chaperone SecB [Gluconacetobacter entanii]MCW4582127.1 protein-export chaperone SecB [Gluconacetobacter entanii]MCW4585514.1 protein-export chaperone SecB [Gluconacetobacter entanii]
MTDKPSDLPKNADAPQEEQAAPQIFRTINIQYVKDLSFEVPNAPLIFQQLQTETPTMQPQIDVQARQITREQPLYEVTLHTKIEASLPPVTPDTQAAARQVFIVELYYCALVTVTGAPEHILEQILEIETPSLLFPFVRNIVNDATRDGGFPPVLLQPVDFAALWHHKRNTFAQAAGHA